MTVTLAQAQSAAEALLTEVFGDTSGYVFDEPAEADFGWVFSYESAAYVETGDLSKKIVGNAPIIVNRAGRAFLTGTAGPLDSYIEALRAEGALQ